jgi:D-alanyl-D-alanine carboxypeptidase
VAENGHRYGFVIRYPEGEEAVTGYKYEPWHVRYVGVELATAMEESGVATLEEFFGLPAAPTYSG